MNYDSIILELMSRVQKLEEEVAALKTDNKSTEVEPSKVKNKITPEMTSLCYSFAKAVYNRRDVDLYSLAEKVAKETGMNVNTANINIVAMIDMLNGNSYKRLLSAESLDLCLGWIYNDFGKQGLEKAVIATKGHIKYLNSIGNPANKLRIVCNKYEQKL